MDQIVISRLVLLLYLAAAAWNDMKYFSVPNGIFYFAYFAAPLLQGAAFIINSISAAVFSLLIYFIGETAGKCTKKEMLGRGDVHIIFIMILYLGFDRSLGALLISLLAALAAVLFSALSDKNPIYFPLAPAFLFGTIAVLW